MFRVNNDDDNDNIVGCLCKTPKNIVLLSIDCSISPSKRKLSLVLILLVPHMVMWRLCIFPLSQESRNRVTKKKIAIFDLQQNVHETFMLIIYFKNLVLQAARMWVFSIWIAVIANASDYKTKRVDRGKWRRKERKKNLVRAK